jgi:pimeloyl-ACP methyl ester carboxylesterase
MLVPFMLAAILTLFSFFPAYRSAVVETQFVQVAPAVPEAMAPVRTRGQARAIVLIHGMWVNLIKKDGITRAVIRTWQKPGSPLVSRLSREGDVFAFAYSQNRPADELADAPDLTAAIQRLRQAGYREVVLVGYSAGGLIARKCVEDHPQLGVTKVIQVCTPNAGTGWAKIGNRRAAQGDFIASLTKETRRRILRQRADRGIPAHLEFACVVATKGIGGDGLVSLQSQWSDDLQRQGIPAYPVAVDHWHAMRNPRSAELIAELVSNPLPRWDSEQVATVRQQILRGPRGR